MNKPQAAAAPETGIIPFEDLLADPEIAELLDFDPAPRQVNRPDGWTPELQRELVARTVHCGSTGIAADQMGKNASGAKRLYRTGGASFQAAVDAAIALAQDREDARRAAAPPPRTSVPGITRRSTRSGPWSMPLAPGQVYNENGMPEDEASLRRRGEDARDSIANKLLGCRRWYLREIARDPGKRAAFELLTELPIDWAKARRMEPQDHEPWRRPNLREPDMVMTAENGWLGSIVPYGPDRIAALRQAVNKERVRRGLPPVTDWVENDGREEDADGEVRFHGISREGTGSRALLAAHERSEDNPSDLADSTDDNTGFRPNTATQPDAPNMRSFDLNSKEFYDRVKQPHQGILPRQPTEWAREPVPKIGPAPRVGQTPTVGQTLNVGPAGRRRK